MWSCHPGGYRATLSPAEPRAELPSAKYIRLSPRSSTQALSTHHTTAASSQSTERESAVPEHHNYTMSSNLAWAVVGAAVTVLVVIGVDVARADECSLRPVIHILSYPGCTSKPIPSFACQGRCTSYVQVRVLCRAGLGWMACCFRCSCCSSLAVRRIVTTFISLQVSGSKLWQTERSCMCCQESGEREAAITLNCPKPRPGEPKEKKQYKSWKGEGTKLFPEFASQKYERLTPVSESCAANTLAVLRSEIVVDVYVTITSILQN
ncbi:Bursicon [Portunus trituberculatus]|uniref:Bursicon n=1 Tax=Portunus trituberculatus TaxID=210409 RepID=A0A5B7G1Z1_PORTR|nr:Bursicon [Portunus trituberculatus]